MDRIVPGYEENVIEGADTLAPAKRHKNKIVTRIQIYKTLPDPAAE